MREALCLTGSFALTVASVILIGNVDGTFANGITFFSAIGIFSCAATLFCILITILLSAAYDLDEKIEQRRNAEKEAKRIMRTIGIDTEKRGKK